MQGSLKKLGNVHQKMHQRYYLEVTFAAVAFFFMFCGPRMMILCCTSNVMHMYWHVPHQDSQLHSSKYLCHLLVHQYMVVQKQREADLEEGRVKELS
jgi:hypothetical protein